MSFIITTYVPDAIILASDSRQTATFNNSANSENVSFETVTSDKCEKIFLFEDQEIGVSVFGETLLGGTPIGHTVRKFKEEFVSPDDDILDIVEKMMRYFSNHYPQANTAFHMSGYKREGNVSCPHVYHCQVSRNEIKRINVKEGTDHIIYGTAWGGQGDVIARLIQPDLKIDKMPDAPPIPTAPILWDIMSVQDAIDFSNFAVKTTTETVRFQARPKNVGGKVNLLAITPKGAQWLQHFDINNIDFLG